MKKVDKSPKILLSDFDKVKTYKILLKNIEKENKEGKKTYTVYSFSMGWLLEVDYRKGYDNIDIGKYLKGRLQLDAYSVEFKISTVFGHDWTMTVSWE